MGRVQAWARDVGGAEFLGSTLQGDTDEEAYVTFKRSFIADVASAGVENFGTPGVTTYDYAIVGRRTSDGAHGAPFVVETNTGAAALTGVDFNRIDPTTSAGDGWDTFDIYRTVGGATQGLIGNITNDGVAVLDDTGLAGDGSTPPTWNDSGPTVGDALYVDADGEVDSTDNTSLDTSRFHSIFESGDPASVPVAVGGTKEANFVTDDGAPVAGFPVYLAGSDNDGGSGVGKLTPIAPVLSGRAIARVGLCVDASGWGASKTAVILIQVFDVEVNP